MDKFTDGLKHDGDKLRLDLLSPEIIEAVGAVMTYGAEKYGEGNYKKVEPSGTEPHLCDIYVNG